MTAKRKPRKDEEPKIRCRRVDATFTVAEHKDCPYCFGKPADVATGQHAAFCDFKPGKDPIIFGFPDEFGRQSQS